MYRDIPFDYRFVVANPGPRENGTFGDIIVLDHIAEDDITANTIKTLEFYKWLPQGGRLQSTSLRLCIKDGHRRMDQCLRLLEQVSFT